MPCDSPWPISAAVEALVRKHFGVVMKRFVEALHTVRASLGLERMHLLGHSWGGALAAAYVLEKGTDGIVSLTLSSPLLSTPAWVADRADRVSQ